MDDVPQIFKDQVFKDDVEGADSIIEELTHRITEFVEKDRSKLRELAEKEASNVIAKAQQEAEALIEEAKGQASKEAERIITEAEEKIKKEAAEKMEKERQHLIKAANDDAEKIINKAREDAEAEAKKISDDLLDKAKQAADQLVSEAKTKAQEEYDQLIASFTEEALKNAEAEAAKIFARNTEKAQNLITDIKIKLGTALAESDRVVMEAHQKVEQSIKSIEEAFVEVEKETGIPPSKPLEPVDEQTSSQEGKPEPAAKAAAPPVNDKDDERSYEGRLEFSIEPPDDLMQIIYFEQRLLQIPHLNLIGKGATSGGGAWATTELLEPVQILKLIKAIPSVKKASWYRDKITITLKSRHDY